jgi:perosamine synthetase
MGLFADERCPNAEFIARRGFYLPSGAGITEEEVRASAAAVEEVLA